MTTKDLQVYYKDENDLIKHYCHDLADCRSCEGTNTNGEPNEFGCDGLYEYLDYHQHLIISEQNKVNEFYSKKEVDKLLETDKRS